MAVQIAAPASDFSKALSSPGTETGSGLAPSHGDGGSEFKNVLSGMRASKKTPNQPSGGESAPSLNFNFRTGENGVDITRLEQIPAAERNEAAELFAGKTSRFDPDVFLEKRNEAAQLKGDTDTDAEKETEKTPEEETISEKTVPASETVISEEMSEIIPAMNSARETAEETPEIAKDSESVSAAVPENNPENIGKTIKNRNARSGKTTEFARRLTEQAGYLEAKKAASERLSGRGDSQNPLENEKSDGDNETQTAKGPEGKEKNVSSGAVKTVSRAAEEPVQKSRPSRETNDGVTPGHAAADASPVPASVSRHTEQHRGEIKQVSHVPVTYTLQSGNKFGDGLRSVLMLMRRDGSSEAHMVVEPPALGRIDVSLRASSSGVEANFRVDNEELRQMVQKQLDSLKESLQAQGIHVSGLTVDIKNNEDDKSRDNTGASKKRRRLSLAEESEQDIAEGTKITRLDLERGLLHWVA